MQSTRCWTFVMSVEVKVIRENYYLGVSNNVLITLPYALNDFGIFTFRTQTPFVVK